MTQPRDKNGRFASNDINKHDIKKAIRNYTHEVPIANTMCFIGFFVSVVAFVTVGLLELLSHGRVNYGILKVCLASWIVVFGAITVDNYYRNEGGFKLR